MGQVCITPTPCLELLAMEWHHMLSKGMSGVFKHFHSFVFFLAEEQEGIGKQWNTYQRYGKWNKCIGKDSGKKDREVWKRTKTLSNRMYLRWSRERKEKLKEIDEKDGHGNSQDCSETDELVKI